MNLICTLSTFKTNNGMLPESTLKISPYGKEIELWSGKSILSYIIPKNINLSMKNSSYDTLSNDELNTKHPNSELCNAIIKFQYDCIEMVC